MIELIIISMDIVWKEVLMFRLPPTKKKRKRKVSTTIYVRLETVIFLLFCLSFYSLFSLSLPGWRCKRTNPSVRFRYIFFLPQMCSRLPFCLSVLLLLFSPLSLFFLASISVGLFYLFIYFKHSCFLWDSGSPT